jgi:hypothetical protein
MESIEEEIGNFGNIETSISNRSKSNKSMHEVSKGMLLL